MCIYIYICVFLNMEGMPSKAESGVLLPKGKPTNLPPNLSNPSRSNSPSLLAGSTRPRRLASVARVMRGGEGLGMRLLNHPLLAVSLSFFKEWVM